MATLLLSATGAVAGSGIGGSFLGLSTGVIGRALGGAVGRVLDQRLLGSGSDVVETGRVDRFRLTGAGEGSRVNGLYGRMRVGGQIIWSTRFQEHVDTDVVGGKGMGGAGTVTKAYSYSISVAVALCEGEILSVGRVWADGAEVARDDLDLRVYRGTESQLPDPKIEAVEGSGNAPAYRGLAYVVIDSLSLGRFGNRVPQFSFEVIRATPPEHVPDTAVSLSELVEGVALIPGTGEYGLATTKVHYEAETGWRKSANVNSTSGVSDFRTSLTQLEEELPKSKSVSLVVSWFGSDLRCGQCKLKPKIEQAEFDGKQMPWRVSGVSRDAAEIVRQARNRPVYGGTPTDQSVVEAISALKHSGKKVMFYPFVLMEQTEGNQLTDPWTGDAGQPAFPWRGRITTSLAPGQLGTVDGTSAAASEVLSFFGAARVDDFTVEGDVVSYRGPAEWSFRRFVLHYAHLCSAAGGVDSFCIGSELRSLTQIRGSANSFPAVQEMIRLAADVRAILGPSTHIGYAADWSEYFGYHPQDGSGDVYFHLDPLWADANIDFIGIDNYMPLSDWRSASVHADAEWGTIYDLDYLKSNVAGGEGYDWYYADVTARDVQDRSPISDGTYGEPWVFRYKDLRNWWSNPHHERLDGVRSPTATEWVPFSKPFWFTEIGCAAIDKGTNQPNKFLDPKSSESELPWHSDGTRDDFIQAQYLRAMYSFWNDPANNPESAIYQEAMIDMSRANVWAWDARPYPRFPGDSSLWSDAANYFKGHWLNGRTSSEALAAVVADICGRAGIDEVDVSKLFGMVRGYSTGDATDARGALQPLALAHGFDASEQNGKLRFRSRTGRTDSVVSEQSLAVSEGLDGHVELTRSAEAGLDGRVRLTSLRAGSDFSVRVTEAIHPGDVGHSTTTSDLPMCLTESEARRIVDRWLAEARVTRDTVRFSLPPSHLPVQAGDNISFDGGAAEGTFRVDRVELGHSQTIDAVRVEAPLYQSVDDSSDDVFLSDAVSPLPVLPVFLDLPLLTGAEDPVSPHLAITSEPWQGSVAVYASSEDDGYGLDHLTDRRSTIGISETGLRAARPGVLDRGPALRVRFASGSLFSVSRSRLLNGSNVAAIGTPAQGDWEVFQFQNANLVSKDTYDLELRLRGQAGTDGIMPTEWPVGSMVVLLNGAAEQISMPSSSRGLERHFRIGPSDRGYGDDSYVHLVKSFQGVGLRPYAPVHLRVRREPNDTHRIGWIRRTRIDGDSWESLDVPLGERDERYLVQVWIADELRREETTTEPSWTYPKSSRTADGVSTSYAVKVSQVSDRFGPGPYRRIDINE